MSICVVSCRNPSRTLRTHLRRTRTLRTQEPYYPSFEGRLRRDIFLRTIHPSRDDSSLEGGRARHSVLGTVGVPRRWEGSVLDVPGPVR